MSKWTAAKVKVVICYYIPYIYIYMYMELQHGCGVFPRPR